MENRNLDYGNRINFLQLKVQSTYRNNFTLKSVGNHDYKIILHLDLFSTQTVKAAKISRKDAKGHEPWILAFAPKNQCVLKNVTSLFWVLGFFL